VSDDVTIDGRKIGQAHPPYVIAEMSGNHNGDIERAFRLIDAAAEAGADAVKLQTYTADTITIDHDGPGFRLEGGLWDGRTLHDLYREAHTPCSRTRSVAASPSSRRRSMRPPSTCSKAWGRRPTRSRRSN